MLAVWLIISSMLYSLRLSNGGSFPKPLTAREEREYLERAAQGDLEARNVLIERNLRLVAHIMKKYYTQTSDQEDLISIGTIGLIKASRLRPKKGARLQHMRQGVLKMQCTRRGVISPSDSQNGTAAQAAIPIFVLATQHNCSFGLRRIFSPIHRLKSLRYTKYICTFQTLSRQKHLPPNALAESCVAALDRIQNRRDCLP